MSNDSLKFNLIKSDKYLFDLILANNVDLNFKNGSLYRGSLDNKIFSLDYNDEVSNLNINSGTLETNYIPYHTPQGFTYTFWLKRDSQNLDDVFFKIKNITNDLFSLSFDGSNLFVSQNILRTNTDSSTIIKNVLFDISLPNQTDWFNITVKYKRLKEIYFCTEASTWLPEIKILDTNVCENDIPLTQKGVMSFFLNARPIYTTDFEESIISLDDLKMTIGVNFNGKIGSLAMYKIPLSVPQIISNFLTQSKNYNNQENFGGVKIITNPSLKL